MPRRQRVLFLGLLLLLCIGCDQGTKRLATETLRSEPPQTHLFGTVRLGYVENPGAFLSLGAAIPEPYRSTVFKVGVGLFLLALAAWTLVRGDLKRLELAAYALFLGGGLSNWFDRLVNDGRVVDFMVLRLGPLRTGVFNVADVAIMVGVGLLLLDLARQRAVSRGAAV